MPRFIHTGDWQLGMTRRFINPDAHARYSQARFDAVRAIGRLARDEDCSLIAVAGDVFEFEQMDRATVARALEAMGGTGVPVVLLPGNHDPWHDDSVYRSEQFEKRSQKNIVVAADSGPIPVADGLEVVGAPWRSKHPAGNPIIGALADLEPDPGVFRICLAHGYADILSFSDRAEALIPVDMVEKALADRKIHYAALGDRHSAHNIGTSGRIRYAGTPEPTDFDEDKPGYALVVDLSRDGAEVRERKIGVWSFLKLERNLAGMEDLLNLIHELEDTPEKNTTVVRLVLSGSLTLSEDDLLRRRLDEMSLLFAGLDVREDGFFINPGDTAKLCGHLSGYAAEAAATLRAMASNDNENARTAGDALLLLSRLAPASGEDGP